MLLQRGALLLELQLEVLPAEEEFRAEGTLPLRPDRVVVVVSIRHAHAQGVSQFDHGRRIRRTQKWSAGRICHRSIHRPRYKPIRTTITQEPHKFRRKEKIFFFILS